MTRESWPIVTAAQMRELDRHTIETLGIPGDLLMESAGRAVTEAVLSLREGDEPVVIVCGAGNNGGDGLVVARHLHQQRVPVRVVLLADVSKLRGDAAANARRAKAVGLAFEGERWTTVLKPEYPVYNISQLAAIEYCHWRTRQASICTNSVSPQT